MFEDTGYEYRIFVTDLKGSAHRVIDIYDKRAGAENLIGEAKREGLCAIPSPVGAAGRVYLLSRDGVAMVIRNSDRFEVLATNKLEDKTDASLALADHEVYLRGNKFLYCIAEK